MALQKRTLFLEVRVFPNGDTQKWTREDIYYDEITPVSHVPATYNKDGSEKTAEIKGVSDIHTIGERHCVTIASSDKTPDDIQAFMDNSKA